MAAPRLASLPNFRDVGGHPTRAGGRVRTGLLYRSTALDRLAPEDSAALVRLGLRTVFDLRTEAERDSQPDRLPPGSQLVVVDVLHDAEGMHPARLKDLMTDARLASAELGGGTAERLFEGAYLDFVRLPSAREGFGRLFRELASAERRPALVHCTTGKDRTGWAVATLLLFLDVPMDVVRADYLRSGEEIMGAFGHVLDEFAARGGDPGVLLPMMEVR